MPVPPTTLTDRPPLGTPEYGEWLRQPGNLDRVIADLNARGCIPSMTSDEFLEMKYGPETASVRILVIDLIIAARALHDFRVVAAGCTYATLELTETQRSRLTEARVTWDFDR